jgi:hypothetical protein
MQIVDRPIVDQIKYRVRTENASARRSADKRKRKLLLPAAPI